MKVDIEALRRLAHLEQGEIRDHAIRACAEIYDLRTAIYEIAYKSTEGDADRMKQVALDVLDKLNAIESKERSDE